MLRMAILVIIIGLCTLAGVTGCNPVRTGIPDDDDAVDSGSENPIEKVGSIHITPSESQLTISSSTQRISFRAASEFLGDITDRASWTLSDGSIGTISQGQLTISATLKLGGSYKIFAAFGDGAGKAIVNLKLIAPPVLDSSAPRDAPDWFSGGSGGPSPSIVYPFDNTMMAPNILQLAMEWRSDSSQKVFRIHVAGPTYERSFYVGSSFCSGGRCTFHMDDKLWSELGHSSLEQPMTIEVAGVAIKGGPIGVSAPVRMKFSPEDCRGGLYYFSTTTMGIKRVPLGADKAIDFIRSGDGTGCAGCHAVSRDGKQVAVEFGSGQTDIGSTVVDGANPKLLNFPLQRNIAWNFAWFNPMGDKLITNWNGTLVVRRAKDGRVLSTISNAKIGGAGGAMPEWSPDGRYITFVRQAVLSRYDFELQGAGDIVVMPYNNGGFGPAVEIVHGYPDREVHFWPSFSPDSHWLVFNSMACIGGVCEQYNATTTRLRLVRAIDDAGNPIAGATPIELLQGTHEPNKSNNWPKFAPFLQKGRYVFVVYSAKYDWGFHPGSNPQLFMFGLDLEQAKLGQDPSYQPIWLPFQESTTANHSAIWTTDVACYSDTDCPGEFTCISGSCVPRIG